MGLPTDTRYKLAADTRRRAVVAVLDADGSPVALANLARQVAAHEMGMTVDAVTGSPQVQRVHLTLYHIHIPKLAEAEVVVYDEDRNTVEVGPEVDSVRSLVKPHTTPVTHKE